MDNKKLQVIISLSLLVCLIVIFVVGFSFKKDNLKPERNIPETRFIETDEDESIKAIDIENDKYYINIINDTSSYELSIDNTGSCILKSLKVDYTMNEDYKYNEILFALSNEELNKVELILTFINNKNSLNDNEYYKFYYDEEEENFNDLKDDKKYVWDLVTAVEYISLNSETIENKTKKEYGNELLDNIIEELNLNTENEKPAN